MKEHSIKITAPSRQVLILGVYFAVFYLLFKLCSYIVGWIVGAS